MSVGLIPVLCSTGPSSEIMKRIAAPMVGGICTSFILELLVYPAIYALWRERTLQPELANNESTAPHYVEDPQFTPGKNETALQLG
jgi:Cu(I)/Ag(I) efflux system membrane protein CusA/SilA